MSSPGTRILLIEEDDGYAALLTAHLAASRMGVTLTRVHSADAAVTHLSGAAADAILLDLEPADGSGYDSIDRVLTAAPGVPVVVLTSSADDAAAAAAVQRGAQDYLVKPELEPGLLARTLRYAMERAAFQHALVEREQQLRQAHKMEAIGRLAGGIAHDFNNVLTAIFGYSDLLLEQLTEEDPRRTDVQEIRRSAERAAALTRQLLAFSRKQVMQPRVIDLNAVVANIERMLARMVGEDVQVEFQPASDLWRVKADPGQIEQVLMNLAANARDAMPDGGRLTIATANRTIPAAAVHPRPGLPPGAYAIVAVSDTGEGMPEEVQRHIFEPFFTTKEQGKGTGLGLATVYGIVKQSGGGIYVDSVVGAGTTFTVYLPRIEEP
jgi:two-component system cell cycle sensor histidine kinase/response regulator CckA